MYRVVVYVGPNQGFKFEHAPHGFIRVANFAADSFVSASFAGLLKSIFDGVGGVQVETRTRRGKNSHCFAPLIRGQQFSCEGFNLDLRNYRLRNKILRHKRIFGAAAVSRAAASAPGVTGIRLKAMVTYNAQNTVRES